MKAEHQNRQPGGLERATFGGGCFWCLEAVYQLVDGVKSVTSGYAGGHTANPTYQAVCAGQTGHAEVIQVAFDPRAVTYERLLEILWEVHDPTTLNRQGADVGTQYRSIVLYHDEPQRLAAERSRTAAQGRWDRPIVTELQALTKFYPAEAYHQNYYRNNPSAGYCQAVIRPKVDKFKRQLGKE